MVINITILIFENVGKKHERMATSLVNDIGNIGGLVEIIFVICWLAYMFLTQPLKDANLAISFNKLNKIINPRRKESLEDEELDLYFH